MFEDALVRLLAAHANRERRLVGIDGLAGSGKSTLAARLAAEVPGTAVVDVDDFCGLTNDGWWRWADPVRVRDEVVEPFRRGETIRYRPFDWDGGLGEPRPERVIPEPTMLIVEGVSALHPILRERYDVRLWVECPQPVRLARGLERDGEVTRAQWVRWMAEEERYVRKARPLECADLVISGVDGQITVTEPGRQP